MVDLNSRKDLFIEGMVNNAGWTKEAALQSFEKNAPLSEIGNETDFILSETTRLRIKFPKIQIAPMLYLVEDNKLYLIKE
jgi:carbonic anhydrase